MLTRSWIIAILAIGLCMAAGPLWAGQEDFSSYNRMEIRAWLPALPANAGSWLPSPRVDSTSSFYPGPMPKNQTELAQQFSDQNFDNLLQDLSRGGGEHLASLAELMKIPADRLAGAFASVQTQYAANPDAVTPAGLVQRLSAAVAAELDR